ncbi:helix-turn-helix domain-containing protein [Leptospira interrogans]|jgi:transcriptional regulator with XRE-family HTH domain
MKIEITKEWCLRMAQLEADAEIGAGLLAVDPVFEGDASMTETLEESNIAFGRFVHLMRRRRGLSLEKLAEDTDVEIVELVEIEEDARHKPTLRTVYLLANYFQVPQGKLQQIAGLTVPRDVRLHDEAVRFAARSETVAALTPEESAALEAFVAVLSEQK